MGESDGGSMPPERALGPCGKQRSPRRGGFAADHLPSLAGRGAHSGGLCLRVRAPDPAAHRIELLVERHSPSSRGQPVRAPWRLQKYQPHIANSTINAMTCTTRLGLNPAANAAIAIGMTAAFWVSQVPALLVAPLVIPK